MSLSLDKVEDFADGFSHLAHEGVRQLRYRTLNEAPIVEGSELIDEEIGVASQAASGRNSDAEWLGILNQVGGKWNNERRGMVRIKKCLGLYDQDRPGLSWLGTSPGIQIREPEFPPLRHRDPARWRRNRR